MSADREPFFGTWRFNPDLSTMCTPAPRSWIQKISASPNGVEIRDEVVRINGTEIVSHVEASFDGEDCTVEGSPAVDTVSYIRPDRNSICAVGKKDGQVAVTETVLADPERRTLTLIYNYMLGERKVAHGVAVFQAA
jgi:hypothetical protein